MGLERHLIDYCQFGADLAFIDQEDVELNEFSVSIRNGWPVATVDRHLPRQHQEVGTGVKREMGNLQRISILKCFHMRAKTRVE